MRDIGKNVRALRVRKKLTQDELAERLYVTRQTVSNYETGRSRPDVDMIVRIAEVLDADVNAVIYGPPVPEERQRGLRRLWTGLGITVALVLLAACLWGPMEELRRYRYDQSLLWLIYTLLVPLLGMAAGWTVLQGLGVLLGFSVPRWRWAPVLRRVMLGVLILCGAAMLPFWIRSFAALLEGVGILENAVEWKHAFWYWGDRVAYMLLSAARCYSFLFWGIGAALWIAGFPAERDRNVPSGKDCQERPAERVKKDGTDAEFFLASDHE